MRITLLQSLGAGVVLGWVIHALAEAILPGGPKVSDLVESYAPILAAFVALLGGSLAYRAAMSRLDYDQRDLARKATLQAKAFDAEYDVRLRAITNRIIRAGRAIRLRGVLDPANVEYIKIQLTGPADRLTFLIDRIWQKLADVDPAMSKKLTSRAIQGETIVRNLKHIVDGVSDNTSNRIDDQEVLTRLIETLNILRGVDAEVNQMVETRLKEAKTKFKKRPRDFSMFDPPSEDRESPQVTQPS